MKGLLTKYSGHSITTEGAARLESNSMYSSAQEQVYEKLRNSILSGVLEPGQRILPDELASGMSVDRTHVREALLRLESESLVNFHSYKGFTVASFTMDDLREIYFLRSILEGAACELAARNLTDGELDQLGQLCEKMDECLANNNLEEMPHLNSTFHETIYLSTKSPRLYKMIVRLWNGFLRSSVGFLTLRAPQMVTQHRAIYEALRSRNPEESKAKIQEHLASALEDLAEYWGERLVSSEDF